MSVTTSKRAARSGLVDDGVCRVEPALRPRPFLIESSLQIFIKGHQLRNGRNLPGVEQRRRREWIELRICFQVGLDALRIEADVIKDVDVLPHRVLQREPAGLTANQRDDFPDHAGPQRGIERRIVNVADEAR